MDSYDGICLDIFHLGESIWKCFSFEMFPKFHTVLLNKEESLFHVDMATLYSIGQNPLMETECLS
jgi:hypothetical protein